MKIGYLTKFLNKRYFAYKLNLKLKKISLFSISKLSYNVVFFNIANMKSKYFLAIYLFFLDMFYYKAPFFLTSWLIYRGKIQTKVTLLGGLTFNFDSISQFLREFFFFVFLRNYEVRTAFSKSLLSISHILCLQFFLKSSFFNYNLRTLFFMNLGKQTLMFSILFNSLVYGERVFMRSIFLVLHSFFLLLFEDFFSSK